MAQQPTLTRAQSARAHYNDVIRDPLNPRKHEVGCSCCPIGELGCSPCCYQRICFLGSAVGGCGACFLCFILMIIFLVHGPDFVAGFMIIFFMPLSILISIIGCCCLCFCKPSDGHGDLEAQRDVAHTAVRREPPPPMATAVVADPVPEMVVQGAVAVPEKGHVVQGAVVPGAVVQGAVVGAGQGSGPDRPHVLQGSIVERQPGGLQGSGGPGFDAEDLILKLGSFGDKKQIVADHCARHKGVSPSPEDVTAIFTPITLSFEAVDVAKALAEHTNMSYPTVVAAVGAATYVGRNDVAAILARDFSPESRQSLMTDVPGLNPRTLGLV